MKTIFFYFLRIPYNVLYLVDTLNMIIKKCYFIKTFIQKFSLCVLLCIILFSVDLRAQEDVPLPTGYRNIALGMLLDDTKKALEIDYLFGYRGERDVSLLPTENRTLIETSSDTWLERCWFQFYEDRLYTIIINFNPEKIDYNSVFNQLLLKYGDPKSLSPERVIWQDEAVTLSLERPVSVKYVDRPLFEDLFDQKRVDESVSEMVRTKILEEL